MDLVITQYFDNGFFPFRFICLMIKLSVTSSLVIHGSQVNTKEIRHLNALDSVKISTLLHLYGEIHSKKYSRPILKDFQCAIEFHVLWVSRSNLVCLICLPCGLV
jgi:hypothetical protein